LIVRREVTVEVYLGRRLRASCSGKDGLSSGLRGQSLRRPAGPTANLVTDLSPGSHEFTMQYLTVEDFAVVFEYRVLTVQPF